MSELERVSFKKGREHQQRLSQPYVPGKRHSKYWTEAENNILKEIYPRRGSIACLAKLGNHRSQLSVYVQAQKLGLTAPKKNGGGGKKEKIVAPEGFDDELRSFYENDKGRRKGELNAFADEAGLPRWWVSKRARKLSLTLPHVKGPPWTAAETELMKQVPLHDPDQCAKIFRENGFSRSPTAIVVRAKRLELSRRYRDTMSATAVSKILGIDNKGVTAELIAGRMQGEKRPTNRRTQQGGDPWSVTPAALRRYIIDHLDRVDLRKVEKFAFVQVVAGEPLEPQKAGSE
jgi:hypothetical protein